MEAEAVSQLSQPRSMATSQGGQAEEGTEAVDSTSSERRGSLDQERRLAERERVQLEYELEVEGELCKRSGKYRKWKPRWFHVQNGKLLWYKDRNNIIKEKQHHLFLDFRCACLVHDQNVSNENVFVIYTNDRVVPLRAPNADAMHKWVKYLNLVAQGLNKNSFKAFTAGMGMGLEKQDKTKTPSIGGTKKKQGKTTNASVGEKGKGKAEKNKKEQDLPITSGSLASGEEEGEASTRRESLSSGKSTSILSLERAELDAERALLAQERLKCEEKRVQCERERLRLVQLRLELLSSKEEEEKKPSQPQSPEQLQIVIDRLAALEKKEKQKEEEERLAALEKKKKQEEEEKKKPSPPKKLPPNPEQQRQLQIVIDRLAALEKKEKQMKSIITRKEKQSQRMLETPDIHNAKRQLKKFTALVKLMPTSGNTALKAACSDAWDVLNGSIHRTGVVSGKTYCWTYMPPGYGKLCNVYGPTPSEVIELSDSGALTYDTLNTICELAEAAETHDMATVITCCQSLQEARDANTDLTVPLERWGEWSAWVHYITTFLKEVCASNVFSSNKQVTSKNKNEQGQKPGLRPGQRQRQKERQARTRKILAEVQKQEQAIQKILTSRK